MPRGVRCTFGLADGNGKVTHSHEFLRVGVVRPELLVLTNPLGVAG